MSQKLLNRFFLGAAALSAPLFSAGQCVECVADQSCSSSDGMPTICPATLPAATAGAFYEENLTFFMPAEVVDDGSGVTATLNTLTVTSITGLPIGIEVVLDEADAIYEPSAGQNLGCAIICGNPLVPGVYTMAIHVSVAVTALGFDQTVTDIFTYTLVVDPGAGGTSTFAYSISAGCASVAVDFNALIFPSEGQVANYAWDFDGADVGTDVTGLAEPSGIVFGEPGEYNVTLTTTIGEFRLQSVSLTGTNDNWSGDVDDFFTTPGDPYFTLTDGNGIVVYTSDWVGNTTSTVWSGLDIPLNQTPYTITFWDDDDLTADDLLGSVAFMPEDNNTLYLNASGTTCSLNISIEAVVSISDSATITVFPTPQPVIANAGDSLFIDGGSWPLTQWYLEGDSIPAPEGTGAALWPELSGWYQADITDSNGCWGLSEPTLFCSLAGMLELEVFWHDAAGTVEVPPDLGNYSWYADGELLPDETLHIADVVPGAVMTVQVTNHPDCPVVSGEIDLDVADFLGQFAPDHPSWNAHPIPFSNELWIGVEAEHLAHCTAQLFDLRGRSVATSPRLSDVGAGKPYHWTGIDVPPGVYILKLRIGSRFLGARRVVRK
jgi:hypothetical protein